MNICGKLSLIQNSKYNVLAVESCSKKMLIGFSNPSIARRVCKDLPLEPTIKLYRKTAENISLDVQRSLMQINVPIRNVSDNITVDVEAELEIRKAKVEEWQVSAEIYHVNMIDSLDFMMYPFSKNIGIVLPYALDLETDDKYVFLCNVVEPSNDVNAFLSSYR